MKERVRWIDIAKGLLIVFVVIGHVVAAYRSAGMLNDSRWFTFLFTFPYTFHMATFFFVSGLLNSWTGTRRLSVLRCIRKRIITYGIPYVLFSVLQCVVKVILSAYANNKIGVSDLLLIIWRPLGYLWFIYALMFMVIINDVIAENKRKILMPIACILYIMQYFVSGKMGTSFTDLIISDFMRFYIYFVLGVLFGQKYVRWLQSIVHKWRGLCVCLAISLFGSGIIQMFPSSKNFVSSLILAFTGGTVILLISIMIDKNHYLESLGTLSMPIYLLHDYFVVAGRIAMNKAGIPLFGGIIPIIVCTFIGVFLPILVYRISQKILHLDFVFTPNKYIR